MKILITGGTGFVGSALTARLLTAGHEVTVIGSSPQCRLPAHPQLTYVSANTTRPGDWQRHVAAQDALVNLAGRSVFNLWTESYKKSIYDSRILTTRNLVDALPAGSEAVLLSTSAAGFYGNGGEEEKTESSPTAVPTPIRASSCRQSNAPSLTPGRARTWSYSPRCARPPTGNGSCCASARNADCGASR